MILAVILSISFSGLPAQLESKAKTALADVQKARTALSAGQTKTGQSWLSKAEALLSSVLGEVPGGNALKKMDQAQGGEPGAVSQAANEAAKLDPSLAAKLGVAQQKAAQGDTSGASADVSNARNETAQKTGLAGLADIYQKVTTARSLLDSGAVSKAKSLLDQIPSVTHGP